MPRFVETNVTRLRPGMKVASPVTLAEFRHNGSAVGEVGGRYVILHPSVVDTSVVLSVSKFLSGDAVPEFTVEARDDLGDTWVRTYTPTSTLAVEA